MELSQAKADALITLEKHYKGEEGYIFPGLGGALRIPLHSPDNREEFSLDITRGRIQLKKNTFQTRCRRTIVLVRLDLGGPPHRNPDGEEMGCPHIHIYREGFGDKWAFPLPETFANPHDSVKALEDFMAYCHIVTRPLISRDLFS